MHSHVHLRYYLGIMVPTEKINEAMKEGNLESVPSDYLEPDFRELCEEIISGQIANNTFVEAYHKLRDTIKQHQ